MAQIDHSIYFRQETPDIVGSAMRGYEGGLRMSELARQKKMQDLKAEEDGAIRSAFREATNLEDDGSVAVDRKKLLSSLLRASPEKAIEAQSQFRQDDFSSLKAKHEKISQLSSILGSASDQDTWNKALQVGQQLGIDVSNEPKIFDPKYRNQALLMSLNAKEQLENALKQQSMKMQGAKIQNDKNVADRKLGLDERKVTLAEKRQNVVGSMRQIGYTDGQRAVDRDFAKDYNSWTQRDRSAALKNIERLEQAKEEINKSLFPTSGRLVGRVPDLMLPENNIKIRESVQAAAQGALRATLGAQFTEKEGERIMNMAYNEKLSPSENIEKIDSALDELYRNLESNDSKSKYYQKNGTLSGYEADFSKPSYAKNGSSLNDLSDDEIDLLFKKLGGGN